MATHQRRDQITQILTQSTEPVSASTLAAQLGVSRQIVVGDVALLRAAGAPIVATPRGYIQECATPAADELVVACRHSAGQLLDELYTVVDCGCGVLDVIVEHPVYGQMSGQLQIFSRYDADLFCDALQRNGAEPLCRLTGDIHLHTLFCPSSAHKARVLGALADKGYLYEK